MSFRQFSRERIRVSVAKFAKKLERRQRKKTVTKRVKFEREIKFERNFEHLKESLPPLDDEPIVISQYSRRGRKRAPVVAAPVVQAPLVIREPYVPRLPAKPLSMIEKPAGPEVMLGLKVARAHVNERIVEAFELKNEFVCAVDLTRLMDMSDKQDWQEAEQMLMCGTTKEVQKYNLQALVAYAMSNRCGKSIKEKLQYVVLELEKLEEKRPILYLLGSHSAVCDVQKDIGVRLAYSAVSEMDDFSSESLKNEVLKTLYNEREVCMEEMYKLHFQTTYVNSHPLAAYRNVIAEEIGLDIMPDEHAVTYEKKDLWHVEYFYTHFYHIERISGTVHKAIADRKIRYDTVVNFLKQTRPEKFKGDWEAFMYEIFDENGSFTKEATAFILNKVGVLEGNGDALFEKEEEVDEIRRSVDPQITKGKEEDED